ncbi:MAG: aminotransferase class I/II-fold pyridoxal phosphate-dependent enzyme [Dehalococcoidia bacterium]
MLAALSLPAGYEDELRRAYTERRATFLALLERNGFDPVRPQGAYYTMAGYARLGTEQPRAFVERMARTARVVAVPGTAFYRPGRGGNPRFAFCKTRRRWPRGPPAGGAVRDGEVASAHDRDGRHRQRVRIRHGGRGAAPFGGGRLARPRSGGRPFGEHWFPRDRS